MSNNLWELGNELGKIKESAAKLTAAETRIFLTPEEWVQEKADESHSKYFLNQLKTQLLLSLVIAAVALLVTSSFFRISIAILLAIAFGIVYFFSNLLGSWRGWRKGYITSYKATLIWVLGITDSKIEHLAELIEVEEKEQGEKVLQQDLETQIKAKKFTNDLLQFKRDHPGDEKGLRDFLNKKNEEYR